MTLWFVFALMTAAAIFAVLWPLGRKPGPPRDGSDTAVYRDQLTEIDRDASAGLIAGPEADAARVEISRRLLAAADAAQPAPAAISTPVRRAVAVLALAGLPLLAVAVYLPLGSPRLPDFPLAERRETPSATEPLDRLVAQVEAHLEKNPGDGRGWSVLAPVLFKLGRFDAAVLAYRNSIATNGDTAERRSDLGEAIAAAANGVVTAEAKSEFERAVALNAEVIKARYFLGLAAEQDGHADKAATIWRAMLSGAPADAPWRAGVEAALARLGGPGAPALSEDAIAAVRGMNDGDRNAMIRGMVERLAGRLKDDGSDVQGWLRLVRAYMVLGERDKAAIAQTDARQALGNDAERLRQFDDGLKALGPETSGRDG